MSIHITPIADLIDHEETDDCLCGPSPHPVERDDGTIGWIWVHHSLDGREATEQDVEEHGGR